MSSEGDQMKSSEKIGEITKSLLKSQKEMEGAKKGSDNPFFKSKYSDYNSVLEACKTILNDNGITILQPLTTEILTNGELVNIVETILVHSSGEFISSQVITHSDKNVQSRMSQITYSRRYGLQSLLSLPSVDDDGEKAVGRKTTKDKATSKTPKKPDNAPSFSKKESRGF